ncbi:MAG: 3-deoxy-7-phosphoheptulonate synthase [Clostridiales bacterium]|jgi:3-deoxy-7-phosphoheptulonate synthase|nr:3-deoxy-7-phosphoheptulonate synthase [Clostridiales bacterium]
MKILSKLPCAAQLKEEIRLSQDAIGKKEQNDAEIAAILRGDCHRLLLIVGPCSADNPAAVLEYAVRLGKIARDVRERICMAVRVFTAKPRTISCGYMGLVHEDGGIQAARRLHLDVCEQTGLPTADELLYTATLPYFDDIVSYFVIGARSVENQEHRLVASGVAAPVGMKNPLSGDLRGMANAVAAARAPHSFIFGGHMVQSTGNPLAHGVLRGGITTPNYHAENLLAAHNLGLSTVIVDTNHANSGKNHVKQPEIAMDVLKSRRECPVIGGLVKGLMVESYIAEGAEQRGKQAFGQSITDPCLGLAATEELIYEIADSARKM